MNNKKRLMRSSNPVFCGVLGGLADYLGIDPTIVRIVFVVLAVCSHGFPAFTIYFVLMLIMPTQRRAQRQSRMAQDDAIYERSAHRQSRAQQDVRNQVNTAEKASESAKNQKPHKIDDDDWSDF